MAEFSKKCWQKGHTMTPNVYVAGSLKNRPLIKVLMNEIEMMGYKITTDWAEDTEVSARLCAKEDIRALQECDYLIYCLDGIPSRGKNFELGYVAALKKPIAIYFLNLNSISHIPIERPGILKYYIDKECVFIRAGMYPIFHTMDDLKSWLSNMPIISNMRK